MTNTDILKRVIEKAVEGGFDIGEWRSQKLNGINSDFHVGTLTELWMIIFSHSFAKAFWGDRPKICMFCGGNALGKLSCYCEDPGYIEKWQYHLQQLALSEDRIKYLETFI